MDRPPREDVRNYEEVLCAVQGQEIFHGYGDFLKKALHTINSSPNTFILGISKEAMVKEQDPANKAKGQESEVPKKSRTQRPPVAPKAKASAIPPLGKKKSVGICDPSMGIAATTHVEGGEEQKQKKKNFRNFHRGIPREGIRRLARRASIKRMSRDAIDDAYDMVYASFLRAGELASVYAMYSKRKTISRDDMQRALADMSNKVYC
jgi:histone H3/H4